MALYGRLDVVRWLGDGPPRVMESLDQAHAAVDRWAERSRRPPLGVWAAEASGTVAGTVLLAELPAAGAPHGPPHDPPHDRDVEIAWHFHPDSWGQGYATEAAEALLTHGFAGGLPRIWALTHLDNAPSMRVCRRLGLPHLGREQPWYDVPMEVFGLTADEFAQRVAVPST